MKLDFLAEVSGESGVANYESGLFNALDEIEEVEARSRPAGFSFPVLETTLQNFFEVPYIVWKSDADIIHVPDQAKATGLFLLPSSKLSNVVVTVHDMSPYVNSYAGIFSQLISNFIAFSVRKVPNLAAISKFTKSELVEKVGIDGSKIDVVYQGVDTDFFEPKEEDSEVLERYDIEKPYIIYVGSEINRKNMPGVIEKFAELQSEDPELTLVKVGDAGRQKYREKTLEAMKDHGLVKGEDVVFTGFVDAEDLPYLYSMAEKTILWSHYEGFGRSVLESKACGTEVVMPDKPPMNEIEFDDIEQSDFRWGVAAEKFIEIYRGLRISS